MIAFLVARHHALLRLTVFLSQESADGSLTFGYPNKSITGLPVVMTRERPLLFWGALRGMSRAW